MVKHKHEKLSDDDKQLLLDLTTERDVNDKTIRSYYDSILQYIEYTGLSLTDLFHEAEKEEDDGVKWKNRQLRKRLIGFRNYLFNKYKYTTGRMYFSRICTVYRHYEFEMQPLPRYNMKNVNQAEPIRFEDLPDKQVIRRALDISPPLFFTMVLFMSSSGCARRETLNLTVNDFMEATSEYHDGTNDIHGALTSMSAMDDIVPVFKLKRQKTNKYYSTFCSPEASTSIIHYLLNRDGVTGDTKIFDTYLYYFNGYFATVNEKLGLGKAGTYNRFRSHMLRKYHASTLYNNGSGLSIDDIDALQGRSKDSTHNSYFMENTNSLKEKYVKNMDVLLIYDNPMELRKKLDSMEGYTVEYGSNKEYKISVNTYLAKERLAKENKENHENMVIRHEVKQEKDDNVSAGRLMDNVKGFRLTSMKTTI